MKARLLKIRPPESNPTAKNMGGPARLIFTTLAIFFVSQLVAVLAIEIGFSIFSPDSSSTIDNSIVSQFLYILIAEALAIWLVFLALKRRGIRAAFIGLGRRPRLTDLGQAAIAFMIFLAILIAINAVINLFSPDLVDKKQNLGFDNINTGFEKLLSFIALVVIPPLGEETLVRGYLYSGLRKIWNFVPAMLTTSLLFGLAHLELGSNAGLVWAAAIDTFFLSIVLVYLREKSGALYAGMLVHMVNNLIAFLVVIK